MSTDPPVDAEHGSETTPGPSKSARKRQMAALQKLGEDLLNLPNQQFARMPLSEALRAALELTKTLRQREARRRQIQYVGKLMRSEDHPAIAAALQRLADDNRYFRRRLDRLEKLTEQLVEGGDEVLGKLVNDHPQLDHQRVRQLTRQARKGLAQHLVDTNDPRHSRKLFEYLRKNLSLD